MGMTKENRTNEAINWALTNHLAMKSSISTVRHTSFALTPSSIHDSSFQKLLQASPIMGKLIHNISEDYQYLMKIIKPLAASDPFFKSLYNMQKAIYKGALSPARAPLLIMRTDFMEDKELGAKLVEFNSIAAGMGPFGQRIHELHHHFSDNKAQLVPNKAIELLSSSIATAAKRIRKEFDDTEQATFLMVVQEGEDNIFDQFLLEQALETLGIKTYRRTFEELFHSLSSGSNKRLMLDNSIAIDSIYLRAGYQCEDYIANDIDEKRCCDALTNTRILMEQHRVAINATVGQQLATSKKVQMLLSSLPASELVNFGISLEEAEAIAPYFGEMLSLTQELIDSFADQNTNDWVLKNQGEGGGHCFFDQDIMTKLRSLSTEQYSAWTLMRRIHPKYRAGSVPVIRNGELSYIEDLINEIGIFTVHLDGEPLTSEAGYAGYLVRSKSARDTEGGVHSGMGVLDSLIKA